jgi:hypothetical protein
MATVVFFVGSIAVYALVMWIHIRKLKTGVRNWSPNKGLTLALGIGRDKLFFSEPKSARTNRIES